MVRALLFFCIRENWHLGRKSILMTSVDLLSLEITSSGKYEAAFQERQLRNA
jgi:hypothetical protein